MKKQLSAVLSAALVVTSLSFSASAADTSGASAPAKAISSATTQTNQPTTEELEALIKLVKPKFDIPAEFKNFTWDYNAGSYDYPSSWHLTWSMVDNKGNISVTADKDGHITGYNKYIQKKDNKTKLPTYLKSELLGTATAFLEKIAPDESKTLQFKNATTYGIYEGSYTYHFTRQENDIPMPSNNATVQVDNQTGEVTSFALSYNYNLDIKKPENLISSEKAIELLKKEQSMELSYRSKYEPTDDGKGKITAYLVYTPKLPYISADAQSGELYKETSEWNTVSTENKAKATPSSADSMSVAKGENAGSYQLTEEETAQLDVLDKLIPREDAIKAVTGNTALYLNPSLTTINATLQKANNYRYPYYYGSDYDCDYVWNINFSNPKPNEKAKYDYSYASAVVNAENGKLISFSTNLYTDAYYTQNKIDVPEVKYTGDQAKSILEDFLKAQIPEKFASSKFTDQNPINVIKYVAEGDVQTPVYGAYNYNYVRMNEGIAYNGNSIHGSVDGITGKIVSFGYNWNNNIVFESPNDAISADQAYDIYMHLDGFGLNYEINRKYTYKEYLLNSEKKPDFIDTNDLYDYTEEVRLVFSSYSTYPDVISAITGKQVDYSGEIYIKTAGSSEGYSYDDISGHWAEKTIRLFGDVNVGFAGGSFKPDEKITVDEFKELLNTAGYYNYSDTATDSEKADGTAPVTRVDAVKSVIKALGFSEIADIKEIYKTDFADNLNIKDNDLGYVAIARGLKIIQGSDGTFRPYDTITRAEALTLIKNTISR